MDSLFDIVEPMAGSVAHGQPTLDYFITMKSADSLTISEEKKHSGMKSLIIVLSADVDLPLPEQTTVFYAPPIYSE